MIPSPPPLLHKRLFLPLYDRFMEQNYGHLPIGVSINTFRTKLTHQKCFVGAQILFKVTCE